MKAGLRRSVAGLAVAGMTLGFATPARADTVLVDGDLLTAGLQSSVGFGTVCVNQTTTKQVLVSLQRSRESRSPSDAQNVTFKNNSTQTLSVGNLPAGVTAAWVGGDAQTATPGGWTGSGTTDGTVAANGATLALTFAAGAAPGATTGTITITASGLNQNDAPLTRSANLSLSAVVSNTGVCAPADNLPPELTLPADVELEATGPGGTTHTYLASATDANDGAVPVTCTPGSGSTFALGSTEVECTATDAAGNTATGSFTVSVVDTTAPAMEPIDDVTLEATGPNGATATFGPFTAVDLVDGERAVSCVPASGSTFALGDTTVTCTASDTRGNAASETFTVTVEDTTPPEVQVPADLTVDPMGIAGAPVTFGPVNAVDLVDGTFAATCSAASGSTFGFGTTTVTCEATDAAGNTGSANFDVTVNNLRRVGFGQPIDMGGILNIVKAGSTVPLKFEVFAGTTELTTVAAVKSFATKEITCSTTAPVDDVEFVTTGATTLRYDTTAGQFVQNWQTPKLAGKCVQVTLTTVDNQTIKANVKLK